ncbi:MAG: leucine-rich repeat protein [Clostridiales bacterium]|jgi:uncharacterized repeat protein (TIGR02543 family)|nr:leucine-rich repeat protein [Clostridiales bacterium]
MKNRFFGKYGVGGWKAVWLAVWLVVALGLSVALAACSGPTDYTITYNLDGGVNHPDNPATYKTGDLPIWLGAPTKDGYAFNGWTPAGTIAADSTGNKTFTAAWTKNDGGGNSGGNGGGNNGGGNDGGGTGGGNGGEQGASYTITYDFLGGSGAQETQTVTFGEDYTLIVPTHDIYNFSGWYDMIGGGYSQNKYTNENGDSLKPYHTAADITLYPYWTGTAGLNYTPGEDGAILLGTMAKADAPKGTLIIQPYYMGQPVTHIENVGAFRMTGSFTTVSFPESIKTLGERAFEGCGIVNLTLPESVESIGDYAFRGCGALITAPLHEGLTDLGKYAFGECLKLTEITIPAGIKTIKSNTFSDCTALTKINLPDALDNIGGYAFMGCTALTEIIIPETVTRIGNSAFQACTALTKVTMKGSVPPTMGINMFASMPDLFMSDLLSIFVPADAVTAYKDKKLNTTSHIYKGIKIYPIDYLKWKDYVVDDAGALLRYVGAAKIITVPNEVTLIKEDAFRGYTALKELKISHSGLSIEPSAFLACTGIEKITLLPSVLPNGRLAKMFNSYGYSLPASLKYIVIKGNADIGYSAFYNQYANSTVISIVFDAESVVESIGTAAFYQFAALEEIIIPESVTTIDERAFSNCPNLTIYAAAAEEPAGWVEGWNGDDRPVYFYSEEERAGNYWRYADGKPTKWD